MGNSLKLERDRAVLLVVDIQEKLCVAMSPDHLDRMVKAVRILIQGAGILGIPVVISEQYAKGLGPTIGAVAEVLPADVIRHEKTSFSCVDDEGLLATMTALSGGSSGNPGSGRDQWLLCGMESHVCLFQTVRDMIGSLELDVFVPADAVLSRTRVNADIGLALMGRAGAVVTSVESVLFDLLGKAGTAEFKVLSALVK